MLSYFLLFLSAFGAATLLPLQSEAVLAALLLKKSTFSFSSHSDCYFRKCIGLMYKLVVRFKNRTV